jgi:hypothetical protein
MFDSLKKKLNIAVDTSDKKLAKKKQEEDDDTLGDLLHNLNAEVKKTGANSKVIRRINGKDIEEDTDEYFKRKKGK